MGRRPILTLTSDFGNEGPYVASMKGVVLSLAPETQFVDVSHSVAPQNILEGAFVLAEVIDVFPPGTVHLAVVDPGVGTDRRLVAVSVEGQWFVLPDNGLISGVLRRHQPEGSWEITDPKVRRANVSSTFHGRDILAPAAAHLLLGNDPAGLGPPCKKLVRLKNFEPARDDHGFVGEVIFQDTFGNLITNIPVDLLADAPPSSWTVAMAGEQIEGLDRTYGARPTGTLIALGGSNGWIEIAVVNGDAARQLSAGPGTTVWVRRPGGLPGSTPRS